MYLWAEGKDLEEESFRMASDTFPSSNPEKQGGDDYRGLKECATPKQ